VDLAKAIRVDLLVRHSIKSVFVGFDVAVPAALGFGLGLPAFRHPAMVREGVSVSAGLGVGFGMAIAWFHSFGIVLLISCPRQYPSE